jgi:hypothetical protein
MVWVWSGWTGIIQIPLLVHLHFIRLPGRQIRKVTARPDGSFTATNTRNGNHKEYGARS